MFSNFPIKYKERAEEQLDALIQIALDEDGEDLTSNAIFDEKHVSKAVILTKEESYIVGLPLIDMIFSKLLTKEQCEDKEQYNIDIHVKEGECYEKNTSFCTIKAPTRSLLKAERVLLNFLTHLSGVANITSQFVKELENTEVTLLDTRKTLPGMRYLEKYAVSCAKAGNHRLALDDMIMIKDNHIDGAGSITKAIQKVREHYSPCPPIEVECRNHQEVFEAVKAMPNRIMLDNMTLDEMRKSLPLIPSTIEIEVSGNVCLDTIKALAQVSNTRKPNFISVGKITHSAPTADFSLKYID